MKKALGIALLALLAFSCSMQVQQEEGSVAFSVSRALTGTEPSVIRYVLTRDGNVIKTADVAVAGTGATITIDELLPTSGYKLSLSLGKKDGNILDVDYCGSTAPFQVTAGGDTQVSIALEKAPDFTYLATSGRPASAVYLNGNLYTLDGPSLYEGTTPIPVALPSDIRINSLTAGKGFAATDSNGDGVNDIVDELWLNTSRGIFRKTAAGFEHIMNAPKDGVAKMEPNVIMSGTTVVEDVIIAFYSGGGKSVGGGGFINQEEFGTAWYSLETEIAKPDFKDFASMIENVNTDLLKDFAVHPDSIYYAVTDLGTIVGNRNMKDIDFSVNPISKIDPFWIKIGDGSVSITRLAVAKDKLYLGTESGLYTATINTDSSSVDHGKVIGSTALVPGSERRKVRSLAAVESEGDVFCAAVFADRSVTIYKNGAVHVNLPAEAGVPEKAKAIFYGTTGGPKLVLSGIDGAIEYSVIR